MKKIPRIILSFVIFISSFIPHQAMAHDKLGLLRVSNESEISSANIFLKDIANIEIETNVPSDTLQRLQAVSLGTSPSPGQEKILKGEEVLAALTVAGFDTEDLMYFIPREISIKRAGHVLSRQELIDVAEKAIKQQAKQDGRRSEIHLRDLRIVQSHIVGKIVTKLEVSRVGQNRRGRVPLSFSVVQDGDIKRTFPAIAIIDEWNIVPAAGRDIERDGILTEEDLTTVRLNLSAQNSDIADLKKDIIGKKAKARIAKGGVFERKNLIVPPLISRGTRVLLSYSSGYLTATATGIAVEDGFRGMVVAVRNDDSKRIVRGIAQEESLVQVSDQIE